MGREVEIKRGEKTDIYVDAIRNHGNVYDTVSVIIETKGCWHPKLKNAMMTQLRDRYLLKNNLCRYGLYLVGWFNCDKWDQEKDSRFGRAPKYGLDEAKTRFENQARDLSKEGIFLESYVLDLSI